MTKDKTPRTADATVPQADSLPKLRRFVEELDARRDVHAAGAAVGLSSRHVRYFVAAAESLELLTREEEGPAISSRGEALLGTEPGSEDEAKELRAAIEASPLVKRVARRLLSETGPTKEALTAQIRAAFPHLAQDTAARRAETLLRWRSHVLSEEDRGAKAAEPPPSYQGRAVLRTLQVDGFKAFGELKAKRALRSTELSLGALTVLCGENGAGKTTILQALGVMGALVRGNIGQMLEEHGWDYEDLPHGGSSKRELTFQAELELGGQLIEWRICLGPSEEPGIASERVRARADEEGSTWRTLLDRVGRQVKILNEATGQETTPPLITLPQSWLSTLEPTSKEDATAYPALTALSDWATRIRVFRHGEELSDLLFSLKREHPKRWKALERRVAELYPKLARVKPKSAPHGWKYLAVTERWNGKKQTIHARQASGGLLRLLAVASIPEWESPPSMVLLDEMESGVHPRLLGRLAELLTDISETTQVLTTTYSPLALDHVPAGDTRLVTRSRSGAIRITRLTDTRGYDSRREQLEPGQLWYHTGEEELVGRGPKD
jgi:predicted ATPase